jgi:hypothetical protein
MSYQIVVKSRRVIVRIIRSPNNDSEVHEFCNEYRKMIDSFVDNINNKHTDKYLVLFDTRAITMSFGNVRYIARLTKFFVSMRQKSEVCLCGIAMVVSNTVLSNVCQGLVDADPGNVPTNINSDIDECKQFLKNLS